MRLPSITTSPRLGFGCSRASRSRFHAQALWPGGKNRIPSWSA